METENRNNLLPTLEQIESAKEYKRSEQLKYGFPITDNEIVSKKHTCPEIKMFGAPYPDARCIDGLLWDLDSCEDGKGPTQGGEIPCPNCNKEEHDLYAADFFDESEN